MSLFGNNNQSNAGGLFGNNNTSSTGGLLGNITSTSNTPTLFGKPNNQPQTQGLFGTNNNSNGQNKNNQSSLFGNNISNNNNTTTNTTSNAGGSLFGNLGNNTGNIFGNLNNNNTNNTNNTNNQQGGLFGAPTTNTNSSTDNKTSFGLFQNNNTGANTTTQTSNSNSPIFGQQNTTTQSTQPAPTLGLQNNKSDNNFSLFSNDNQKALGKPATNDNNTQSQAKPQNSLFSNITSGTSLFGAPKPEEKKQNETNNLFNNTNTQAQNQTQPQTQNKESEEKKIETKPQNALFGANINSQAGTGSNSLFSNIANNKPEEKKNENNNNNNNNQGLNATNILNQNQNPLNQNQPKKENKDELNNLNNLNNNDLNIKIPEKPFDVSLSNAKELEEFEKNQMLYKTNGEILEEFKKMLFNQQAKYKQCVQNTRKFEQKVMGLIEITNTNAIISKHNGKKGKKIIDKINTINHLSKNLENIITNFNDKLNANLIPFKDNIMNSDKFLLNENNSEKFKFYENFDQISDKCYLIENAVNEAEQNFFKKEKEIGEKNKNEQDGIWIEKNNKKIFINQNEMNNLFSECYDGLANLKNMQDNIDKQYEILKSKLIKSNRNNYNMNYNINNIY